MVVLSSSSASATVALESATSEGLMSPHQTLNIGICNSINPDHEQAEDVVMAVKKRLQDKNPNVQFLSLMLLETMVKNFGDSVHFQIVEKKILEVMIKIVKKKANMQVVEKILELLDTWQETFGVTGGKHPQYYYAYEELRRSGVEFPKRSLDAAPTFTPPVTHPTPRIAQPEYGMSSNSARMIGEAIPTEIESLRSAMEVLSEMLQAVNPTDPAAVEGEAIVELVNICRSGQEKLMQKLTITADDKLLCLGPELNSSLLSLLAKCDGIASGASGASGARVFVTGPQYCYPSTVVLEISREARSTSNFVVRDVNGDVIFRVYREKDNMPGGVLVDRAGIPVFLIKKQKPTLHGRWVVYKGKGTEKRNSIFNVRRPEVTGEKTKLVVFLAVNKKETVLDFKMEESPSENLPVIYSGESSTKVAEVHKKAVSTSEDITVVKIYPNNDIGFIVTLVVIHECIKEIGENRQKYFRRAGRVAAAVGLHLLFEGLENSVC